jgi:hypothetical protein
MIASYSDLTAAVAAYLARDDLTSQIPTFVQLTEAKLNRELMVRQMDSRATALVNMLSAEPEFISLPLDFQSMRRIRNGTTQGKPSINYLSPVQLDEIRYSGANIAGKPNYFTIFGSEMELYPTPDAVYTLEMIYRATIPPLASNATNWLLTLAPDIYLYGALLEAAPYIKEDARIQVWGAGFSTAVDGLQRLGMNSTYNAGPLQVRISGDVF